MGRSTLMKIAIVVQRYGTEINGGAELHARLIAEHLSEKHDITVLTTTAKDYLSWENFFPTGETVIEKIPVIRFKVKHPRRYHRFISIQNKVFFQEHSDNEEKKWIKENGPFVPKLIKYIKQHRADFDFFIFFSFRYYTSFEGVFAAKLKSLLVPTAEEDEAIQLNIVRNFFKQPAGIIYNSIEEKELITSTANNSNVPSKIVGVGLNVLEGDEVRFREKYNITGSYIIYVGRIDKNKGCNQLFDYIMRFFEREKCEFELLLMGGQYMKIPPHPRIKKLGFVSEQDKFDGLKGSLLMVIPSRLESLCMAALESWTQRKPILVNGHCKVLKGQVKRANGGLYYKTYNEFSEALKRLVDDENLRSKIGQQGYDYFKKNYDWQVIMNKYDQIFQMVQDKY